MPDLLERLKKSVADRYAVWSVIGRGGMATVFLAEDLKHRRKVAIKVLHPELAAAVGPQRFLREIEAVAGLTHPHVLPLHDSGEAQGLLFYVMPYVEGESLRQRLERERQLPVDEAVRIAQDVVEALDHAHRHGLVHRDIKPGNILLEEGHAVVTDFGVARAVSGTGGESVTATGMAVGTPAYMSPEQAAGEEVDERSDVYSLACVLYEMLSGEPPLVGSTPQATAAKRLTERPTPLRALRDGVSVELSQAVEAALSRTPVDRYSSALEFSEALEGRFTSEESASHSSKWGRRSLFVASIMATMAVMIVLALTLGPRRQGAAYPRSAIAVLPFENLSPDSANAYFAGGLHDVLLTQLGKIASLTVISRTSMRQYVDTELSIRKIADELGVGSIVEGSVQVVGDRLRVNVQLIDAHTDKHLWSESYDRTLDDAFSIQSDVAQHIVEAVGVALAESERTAYGAAPTDNAEAYQLYLQGREYQRRLSGDNKEALAIAQQLYERAIELDPDFALAHASLSEVHGVMYWAKHDPLPARPDAQLREAQTALRLDPDLPEAHFAMGFWHYVARRDWQAALDQYAIAARGMPNDAHLIERIGYTHRRMGNWKGVFEAFERAIRIEPRNATLHYDLAGHTYRLTRQFDEASRAYARALSLSPDFHDAAVAKGLAHLALSGELDTLRAVLERIPSNDPWWYRGAIVLLFLERDADSVLSVLRRRGASTVAWDDRFVPTSLTAGRAHLVRGDTTSAMAAFDSALVVLDSALLVLGDDWRVHASRGWALAGLGRRNEAMDEARWLQDSEEYRDDAFMRSDLGLSRASILTLLGEHDLALDEIEQELARPSWLSVNGLRLSPTWDGLRDDPRFQQLLAAYD